MLRDSRRTCRLQAEEPSGSGFCRFSSIAGARGTIPEQLQQVVTGADQMPFPVDLLQAPQQELPETTTLYMIRPNTASTVSIRRA